MERNIGSDSLIVYDFYGSDCVQVNRLSMDIQIDYFNITRKQIDKLLGPSNARQYIMKKSIFSVTVGANDFLNNYLLPVLSIGARISQTPDQFIDDVITHLRGQLNVIKHLSLFSDTQLRDFIF